MKAIATILCFVFVALTALAATPSYWWSQMIVKPDAKQSQEFFFVPGAGINFTYATNRVIINAGGSGIGLTTNICVVFCDGSTNTLNITNGLIMAINSTTPPAHGPSWIWPNGGYILWPNGGTILLP